MSDKVKDNEFLASLDLELLEKLVEYHSRGESEASINIVSLKDFHEEEPLKKAS